MKEISMETKEQLIKELDGMYILAFKEKVNEIMRFCRDNNLSSIITSVVSIETLNNFCESVMDGTYAYVKSYDYFKRAEYLSAKIKGVSPNYNAYGFVHRDVWDNYSDLDTSHADCLIYRLQRYIKDGLTAYKYGTI